MNPSRQRKSVLLVIGLIGVPAACYAVMTGLIRVLTALNQCASAPGMQNCTDNDAPFYFWIAMLILLATAASAAFVAAIPARAKARARTFRIRRRRTLGIARRSRYSRPLPQR